MDPYSLCTAAEADSRRIVEDWGSLTWLAGGTIGNARGLTLGRVVIKKGCCNPCHIHNNCEEALYLLTGRLEHTMGDRKVVLNPGDTLVVAAGVAHNAVSIGAEDADMIVAYSSANRDFVPEGRWREGRLRVAADVNVLPTPQSVTVSDDGISLSGDFVFQIVTGLEPDPKVRLAAEVLRQDLVSRLAVPSSRVTIVPHPAGRGPTILLLDVDKLGPRAGDLTPADLDAIHTFKQGYVLRTQAPAAVSIFGHPQGILWGAMTLLQLLQRRGSALCIPGVTIRDFPDFDIRVAADWMTNAEGNRSSMDRGQGWQGFEDVCKRKIDQCLRYKINGVLFDGFGWSLEQRDPQYPQVVSRITRYARQRGIHLSFGGYGAGYGMVFQKGPLYEDAKYLGKVFLNREHYPDGPVYPCTGETRVRAVRKGKDTRILGTCRGNEALNRLKAEELQAFVRAVEPGMLYIHHEDYGSVRNTEAAWQARCDRCRQRWPNDDGTASDGAAGSVAEGYKWLINAINEVANPATGYVAARDCRILLVSPVYCLSDHTPESWDATLRFWQNAGRCLPAASNVMVCFREIFPMPQRGGSWTAAFNAAMREAGLDLGSIIFFITGGDHWLNDYPFVGASALNNLFLGAQGIFHDNGNAYQEPLQILNAEYCWNTRSTGYAPRPRDYNETWQLWIRLTENEVKPQEIFGEDGLLHRACAALYGPEAAAPMACYFGASRPLQEQVPIDEGLGTHQDAEPQRRSYLPMSPDKVHAVPVLWRALALDAKTWGGQIDNERMLTEMERLRIDRPELHRRLIRRWTVTGEMFEMGQGLLNAAIKVASAQARGDLQFLLDATRVKLPLARSLAVFHEAILEMLTGPADRTRLDELLKDALSLAQEASGLARRHYPDIVDPVSEAGAVRTCLDRLEAAIRNRIVHL